MNLDSIRKKIGTTNTRRLVIYIQAVLFLHHRNAGKLPPPQGVIESDHEVEEIIDRVGYYARNTEMNVNFDAITREEWSALIQEAFDYGTHYAYSDEWEDFQLVAHYSRAGRSFQFPSGDNWRVTLRRQGKQITFAYRAARPLTEEKDELCKNVVYALLLHYHMLKPPPEVYATFRQKYFADADDKWAGYREWDEVFARVRNIADVTLEGIEEFFGDSLDDEFSEDKVVKAFAEGLKERER